MSREVLTRAELGWIDVANYPAALKATGLYFSQWVIWDKQHPVLTRKDFMGAHEVCFYGWREGAGRTRRARLPPGPALLAPRM